MRHADSHPGEGQAHQAASPLREPLGHEGTARHPSDGAYAGGGQHAGHEVEVPHGGDAAGGETRGAEHDPADDHHAPRTQAVDEGTHHR
jgi:hypothetical protein